MSIFNLEQEVQGGIEIGGHTSVFVDARELVDEVSSIGRGGLYGCKS